MQNIDRGIAQNLIKPYQHKYRADKPVVFIIFRHILNFELHH
uniref:Uncharacterized protein n=1 Tax=Methylophaga nitratireducenticrescens TaxID=754476 RepID=I1XME2_METNJ